MLKKALRNSALMGMLFVAMIMLIACAPVADTGGDSAGGDSADSAEDTSEKATIMLAENPWPAAELNVAVAKIVIENELGNEVELVALDENVQWDALA